MRRLALDKFTTELPQWYTSYAESTDFQRYTKLEAGLSQKARDVGYLEKGDLMWVAIWGSDEERHQLGTKICNSNRAEEVVEHSRKAIQNLDNPRDALVSVRRIRYVGLAYGSKVLRCVCPENYAALDYRIREACQDFLPEMDDEESELIGYLGFLEICQRIQEGISVAGPRPGGLWFMADVEMAMFQFALPRERGGADGRLVYG